MIRALSADFARRVVQTAIGARLRAHFKISDELPSRLRALTTLMGRQDAVGAAPRLPSNLPVENNAALERRATGQPRENLKRKAAALLTRGGGSHGR